MIAAFPPQIAVGDLSQLGVHDLRGDVQCRAVPLRPLRQQLTYVGALEVFGHATFYRIHNEDTVSRIRRRLLLENAPQPVHNPLTFGLFRFLAWGLGRLWRRLRLARCRRRYGDRFHRPRLTAPRYNWRRG